ncbi:hypothetical protein Tco_1145458 [Tanacetum coccineum]
MARIEFVLPLPIPLPPPSIIHHPLIKSMMIMMRMTKRDKVNREGDQEFLEGEEEAINTPSPQPTNPFLDDPLDASPRPSNPLPLQSHPSLDITLSLSSITPLDHMFETPSPPQPPLMGHPIFFNALDYHGAHCICCFHNRNLILSLRDEMHFMFSHIEYLLTSAISSPSPPHH